MKKCTKCGEFKELSAFYKHPGMKDGLLNKCKECTKKDVKENRKNNAEYYREYDKNRFRNDPRVRVRHKKYLQTEKGKLAAARAKKKYIEQNLIKRYAHIITGNAIRDGKLVKEPCEVCGSLKVHAHHDDYAYPMNVRWLCPKHHKEWHDLNGEGLNAC